MLRQINNAPASQLQQAEKEIREWKEKVKKYETQANEQEAKLNQGLFLLCTYNEYHIKFDCLIIKLAMLPIILCVPGQSTCAVVLSMLQLNLVKVLYLICFG
jgi:hypothetical protein